MSASTSHNSDDTSCRRVARAAGPACIALRALAPALFAALAFSTACAGTQRADTAPADCSAILARAMADPWGASYAIDSDPEGFTRLNHDPGEGYVVRFERVLNGAAEYGRYSLTCAEHGISLVRTNSSAGSAEFEPPIPVLPLDGSSGTSFGTARLWVDGDESTAPYRLAWEREDANAPPMQLALPLDWHRVRSTLAIQGVMTVSTDQHVGVGAMLVAAERVEHVEIQGFGETISESLESLSHSGGAASGTR